MCWDPQLVYRAGEKNKDGKVQLRDIHRPCNRCVMCKKKRVNDWVTRLIEEEKAAITSMFVTLTYIQEKLPYIEWQQTLVKKDLQLFIKRLRKKNQEKIVYYAVGEYGEKTKRPHYHLILFNVVDTEYILDAWSDYIGNSTRGNALFHPIGRVHIGTVTPASMAYVVGYINKGKTVPVFKGDKREKEFALISKGIGKSFVENERNVNHIRKNYLGCHISRNNHKFGIPKYYKGKIGFSERQKMDRALEAKTAKEKKEEKEIREFVNMSEKDYFTAVSEWQIEQEIKFNSKITRDGI